MTVGKELRKYRPMTTGEVLGMIWTQLTPYSLAAFIGLLLSAGVATDGTRMPATGVAFYIFATFFLIILFTILRSRNRSTIAEAIREYYTRKDGYWIIYTARDDFTYIHSLGPMTSSAFHERNKTLKTENGFHVCLSLKDGEKGFAVMGRPCEAQSQNDQLRDWRFVPIHLSCQVTDEEIFVRLEVWNAPGSLDLPLTAAINFLVKCPVGWLAHNTVVGAINSMIRIKTDLKKKLESEKQNLAEANSRFDQAVDALVNAVAETQETQRFLRSKGGKLIRQAVEQKLIELLPADDRRRPRQPDPKIAAMS